MTEEISICGFVLDGAAPGMVRSKERMDWVAGSFDRIVEMLWLPGRSIVIAQLRSQEHPDGTRATEASLLVGAAGSTGTSSSQAATMAALTSLSLRESGMPYSIADADPATHLTVVGDHRALIRQHMMTLDDGIEEVSVLSRFNPTQDPWSRVAKVLTLRPEPTTVRATVLATELSPSDQIAIQLSTQGADRIGARAGERPDLQVLSRKVVDTLTDLRASLAAPPLVVELAVVSTAPLDDVFLNAIGRSFTSEFCVLRQAGHTVVAGQQLLLGGLSVERDPAGLEESMTLGIPLRGGAAPRELRDLITLTESPIGLPIPLGDAVPGIPPTVVRAFPTPMVFRSGAAIGRDPAGDEVCLPDEVRPTHVLVTGTTGTGKSTALFHLGRYDAVRERGFTLLDAHGTVAQRVRRELDRVGANPVVLDADDPATDSIAPFPAFGDASREDVEAAIVRFADAVATSFEDAAWTGPRWYDIACALFALTAAHRVPLPVALGWLDDPAELSAACRHRELRPDQTAALTTLHDRSMTDSAAVRQWFRSKFALLFRGRAGRLFAAPGSGVDVSAAAAAGRTIVVDLGALSSSESRIVGHVVLSAVLDGLMGGAGSAEFGPGISTPYAIYVDEAHRYPAGGLTRAISEGRKFGVELVLASQSLAQFDPALRDAAAGIATQLAFRQSPSTASHLATLVGVSSEDLGQLPRMHAYLRWVESEPVALRLLAFDELQG